MHAHLCTQYQSSAWCAACQWTWELWVLNYSPVLNKLGKCNSTGKFVVGSDMQVVTVLCHPTTLWTWLCSWFIPVYIIKNAEHITIAQNKNKQNSCGLSLLSFRKFRPLSSMKIHSTQCFSHTHSDIAHQMFPASWVLCGYLYSQKDKSLWLSVDSHMLYAQCSCSICYRLLNSPAQKLAPFSKKTSPLWRKIFLKKKKKSCSFQEDVRNVYVLWVIYSSYKVFCLTYQSTVYLWFRILGKQVKILQILSLVSAYKGILSYSYCLWYSVLSSSLPMKVFSYCQ